MNVRKQVVWFENFFSERVSEDKDSRSWEVLMPLRVQMLKKQDKWFSECEKKQKRTPGQHE